MNNKIIFFDVDGTLVNFSCEMPNSTKKALSTLKNNGHKLIICTGRSKSEVYPWLLDMEWDGMICGAGAYVEYEGREIYARYMELKAVEIITDYLEGNNGTYVLEGSTEIWEKESLTEKNRFLISQWIKSSDGNGNNSPIPDATLFTDITKVHHVHKLNFHGIELPADKMISDLNAVLDKYNLPHIFAIKFNHGNVFNTSGEITLEGIHKSYGIDILLKETGLKIEDTVAFGDSLNDYEMVHMCNLGVAMGNACEELKNTADYVTNHIDEDGIYNACVKLELF